ncbi:MAG: hypothetical protein R8G34_02805 [Paracoccaceae bacterium]|nr:hypothetical protein [Paracoccaceae bacterium]
MTQNGSRISGQKTATTSKARNERPGRKAISPIALRLAPGERNKLEEMTARMTLRALIRACIFSEETKRRKQRPKDVIADQKAAAEALALLIQSRIANTPINWRFKPTLEL